MPLFPEGLVVALDEDGVVEATSAETGLADLGTELLQGSLGLLPALGADCDLSPGHE